MSRYSSQSASGHWLQQMQRASNTTENHSLAAPVALGHERRQVLDMDLEHLEEGIPFVGGEDSCVVAYDSLGQALGANSGDELVRSLVDVRVFRQGVRFTLPVNS
eukprot:762630-Hanusia_phi.AAC.1